MFGKVKYLSKILSSTMIKIQTVGSSTASFSRHGYQRKAMTYRRPNLGVDWNSSSGRTCSRFRFRRLWGREDRERARVSVVKTSGGKKWNVRCCENDLMRSTDQWVCVCVVRLSEAERESENQGNKDGKVVWLAHRYAGNWITRWMRQQGKHKRHTDRPIHLSD